MTEGSAPQMNFYVSASATGGGAIGGSGAAQTAGYASAANLNTAAMREQAMAQASLSNTIQQVNAGLANQKYEEQELAREWETRNSDIRAMRGQMIGLSISMFVTTLIVRQLVTGVVQLGKALGLSEKEAKEWNKAAQGMNAIMGAVLGPMQLYITYRTLMIQDDKAAAASTMGFAGALFGLYMIFLAIKTTAPAVRAALAAIGTTIIALTAIQWAKNISATFGAMLEGPYGWAKVALAVGAASAVAGMAAAYTAPKAETSIGATRIVEREGIIYAHKGESVGRVSGPEAPIGGSRGGSTFILNGGDAIQIAKMVERYDNMGLGRVYKKRNVA